MYECALEQESTNHNPHQTQIKSLKTMKFIEENCRRILSIIKFLNTHLVHIIHGLVLDCNRCSTDIPHKKKETKFIISSGKFLISVCAVFLPFFSFLFFKNIFRFLYVVFGRRCWAFLQCSFIVIKTTIVIRTKFVSMHMLRYWCVSNK